MLATGSADRAPGPVDRPIAQALPASVWKFWVQASADRARGPVDRPGAPSTSNLCFGRPTQGVRSTDLLLFARLAYIANSFEYPTLIDSCCLPFVVVIYYRL